MGEREGGREGVTSSWCDLGGWVGGREEGRKGGREGVTTSWWELGG